METVFCQLSFLWCLPSMLLTALIQRWQDIVGVIQTDTRMGNADKPACLLVEHVLAEACAVLPEYSWSITIGEYPMGFTFRPSRYPCMVCKASKTRRRK
jgi:hypothetical protein